MQSLSPPPAPRFSRSKGLWSLGHFPIHILSSRGISPHRGQPANFRGAGVLCRSTGEWFFGPLTRDQLSSSFWLARDQQPARHGSAAPELPRLRSPIFRSEIPLARFLVLTMLHPFELSRYRRSLCTTSSSASPAR